ncbi:MAG: archease [Nanoarchaeota archaeon]|nr:archease [Nanoarchaeota archaeon]
MKKFIFLEHTADIKFQAFGKSLEKAFENSAYALKKTIYSKKIKKKLIKKVSIKGKDQESLLYNFLEELIFLFDSEKFLLSKIKELKIEENKLKAILVGDLAENYNLEMHIKAITYNEMFVKKEKNKWIVQVVLDI